MGSALICDARYQLVIKLIFVVYCLSGIISDFYVFISSFAMMSQNAANTASIAQFLPCLCKDSFPCCTYPLNMEIKISACSDPRMTSCLVCDRRWIARNGLFLTILYRSIFFSNSEQRHCMSTILL